MQFSQEDKVVFSVNKTKGANNNLLKFVWLRIRSSTFDCAGLR